MHPTVGQWKGAKERTSPASGETENLGPGEGLVELQRKVYVARLPGHLSTVRSLWSEDGLVLSGDSAGVVRLWESFVTKWARARARVRGGTGL